MPTIETMSKAVDRNVSRATRSEKVQQPNHNPMPAMDKGNPRQGNSTLRITRPAIAAAPSSTQWSAAPPSGSGLSVEKALVWLGFFVAFVLVMLFGVDLACAWPLGRYTPVAEGVFFSCGLLLGYLSWDAYRDLH